MRKYYTRPCNFHYGNYGKHLVRIKKALPLAGNTKISFDQLEMYNLMTILIIFINLLIVYLIIKSKDYTAYFFLIILGGSLGNLFDRIYYSAVPDFIDISYKGYHWFVFNVADIFISLGIICLIFAELLNYKKKNEI